jgi:alkyl hydroperoxide reductase subunit AhpC
MTLAIGDTAPDFEAETTEGKIRFHDWLGNSWGVLFSHPKDFTPVCTTELGTMARLKPEFDKRNVKIVGLSVDPVDNHKKWAADIKDVVGFAPNYPMIGDTDLKISKAYGMLPASTSGTSEGRTPADNQTVRNVFIVGPDKKIKLILVYPMTTGRLSADDGKAPRRDAGQLETGRGRDHSRLGNGRRSQENLATGIQGTAALHSYCPATARLGETHGLRSEGAGFKVRAFAILTTAGAD